MSQSNENLEPRWYVVHTYSGYENKVKTVGPALGSSGVNIMQFVKEFNDRTANQPGMIIPVVITVYKDKSFTFITKVPPVAVLIKKAIKIQKGSGTDPIPLTDEEIRNMGFDEVPVNIDYDVNDNVRVINGPLENFVGVVEEINKEKHKVKVLVSMFGRETPVELEFSQVQKID